MSRYILDIETNRLENPDKIWCAVLRDIDTDEVEVFTNLHEYSEEFQKRLESAHQIIGHNIINFDIYVIRSFGYRVNIGYPSIIDTLVCSRLLNYRIEGGHSLEAWGKRLGFHKIEFDDFSQLSDEMVAYCIQDTLVTKKLYEKFKPYLEREDLQPSFKLEHLSAYFCKYHLENSGFLFDTERAAELHREIKTRLDELDKKFSEVFEPQLVLVREFVPKKTKKGTISRVGFNDLGKPGIVFKQFNRVISSIDDVVPYELVSKYRLVDFNPLSEKMVIDYLWQWGWQPINKTKGHIEAEKNGNKEKLEHFRRYGWKLDEENLSTIPPDAPQVAKDLQEYLVLASRLSLLEGWQKLVKEDNRIHGRFLHIGTWTHRMAHQNPNMGNVPSRGIYGKEFRSLWISPYNAYLVGTDADGIQIRIFAHYADDKRLIDVIVSGGDIHSLHAEYLGGVERDKAKRFIYAFLFDVGVKKTAEILGCSIDEARERLNMFLSNYPNLKKLKEHVLPRLAARGYFRGLDGRYVVCNSTHLMLAGFCQSGEAIVMKLAAGLWLDELKKKDIPFEFVNFVHDEFQTYVYGNEELAHEVGNIQARAIEKAGKLLGVKCPLSGSYEIGKNWHETH